MNLTRTITAFNKAFKTVHIGIVNQANEPVPVESADSQADFLALYRRIYKDGRELSVLDLRYPIRSATNLPSCFIQRATSN